MGRRAVLAGLLGGVAMFVWASVAHMALGLGSVGIQEMPNEGPLLAVMESSLASGKGLYLFPAMGSGGMAGYQSKLDQSPSGLLIYHPPGARAMEPRQLITELVTELLEALIAVFLLTRTSIAGFAGRVGFVTLAGIAAVITTNVSYWNWYGFPASYTAAYMFVQLVGYVLVGVVAALMLKPANAA
ncbi:MAG TPA: hypothetical protein VMJ34_15735 [Bryobacteraceae bacterium]|nr:hypothetical protein [Bryobacteraceae bacterium]